MSDPKKRPEPWHYSERYNRDDDMEYDSHDDERYDEEEEHREEEDLERF